MAQRDPNELRESAKQGGERTKERYGSEHYKEIGAKGGRAGAGKKRGPRGPYKKREKPVPPPLVDEIDDMINRMGGTP